MIEGNYLRKIKPAHAYALLVATVLSSFAFNRFIDVRWGDVKFIDVPVHSTLEAVGSTLAILMVILLMQKKDDEQSGKFFLLAMGFLSMGILDAFHAAAAMGHGLVMLHGLSDVAGGIWFSLILFPGLASNRDAKWKKTAPWAVAVFSIMFGIFTRAGLQTMPVMMQDGEYTVEARAIHFGAGLLFVASSVRLAIDNYRHERSEFCLFIPMALLFGSAGFSYSFSSQWNITWWSWHVLRLIGYLAVLIFLVLDRKRTEDELKKSRQVSGDRLAELQAIYATAPVGLCFVDTDLKIRTINYRLSEITGIPVESTVGRTIREALPNAADVLEARFRYVIELGGPVEGREFHGVTEAYPDEERDLLINYYPVKDKTGKVFGINVVVQDVTELKQSRELKLRLSAIVESSGDAIFSQSPEGIILTWNAGAERIFGYTAGEALGTHYATLCIFKEDEIAGIIEKIKRDMHVERYETSCTRKDSKELYLSINFSPIKNESGRLIGVLVIAHDITEHKLLEMELESLNSRHKLILEAADEGIIGINLNGEHTFVNHNAAAMLGHSSVELIGKLSHPIWHHTRVDGSPYDENECNIYGTLRDGIVRRIDGEVFWKKDGTSFPVEYATTPVYKERQIAGTVVTFRDITSRKVAEERLNNVLSELERSNRELEDFAYIASHDLQEPLRMVSSFLQLLESKYKGHLDEKADQYIHYAVEGAGRMQALIADLLAYSRLLRKSEFRPVDLNLVMEEALSDLAAGIRESNAMITSDALPTVPGVKSQLLQLFQNLIGNAIKFRRPGAHPLVHVSAKKGDNEWVFSISDNGIGIEREYFDRIFQIFQRLHTRDEYSGTGIGLTLCKKIVEGHNGRIWVESVPGKETIFFFTLPVSREGTK